MPSTVRRDSTPRPPWIGKIANTGPRRHVAGIGHQPGNHAQQIAVAPDARHVSHGFVVERDLALRALDVDDRRFTGHGDGLLHAPDAQFAVDRNDSRPANQHTIAPQGDEPRQGEGDRVGARPQSLRCGIVRCYPTPSCGPSRSTPDWRLPPSRLAARRRTNLSRGRPWSPGPTPSTGRRGGTPALRTFVHTHASVNSPFGCSRAKAAPQTRPKDDYFA